MSGTSPPPLIPVPDLLDVDPQIAHPVSPTQSLTVHDLARMLTDPASHKFSTIIILDGRFRYEFQGGHIIGAQNVLKRSDFETCFHKFKNENVCIVIHCEYSRNRGPTICMNFRAYDRSENIESYPKLSYPHLFLLEGGYKAFFAQYPELCTGGYVSMRDEKFVKNGELVRSNSFYHREMSRSLTPDSAGVRMMRSRSQDTPVYRWTQGVEQVLLQERDLFGQTPPARSECDASDSEVNVKA